VKRRIEFKIDDQLFNFIKQYSRSEQSTMSEVLRGLLTTLKRKEQRRERKSARVQETAPNQLTLFKDSITAKPSAIDSHHHKEIKHGCKTRIQYSPTRPCFCGGRDTN